MLGLQLLEVVVILIWTVGTTMPFFILLRHLDWLRIPDEIQREGLDLHEHSTYSLNSGSHNNLTVLQVSKSPRTAKVTPSEAAVDDDKDDI